MPGPMSLLCRGDTSAHCVYQSTLTVVLQEILPVWHLGISAPMGRESRCSHSVGYSPRSRWQWQSGSHLPADWTSDRVLQVDLAKANERTFLPPSPPCDF